LVIPAQLECPETCHLAFAQLEMGRGINDRGIGLCHGFAKHPHPAKSFSIVASVNSNPT